SRRDFKRSRSDPDRICENDLDRLLRSSRDGKSNLEGFPKIRLIDKKRKMNSDKNPQNAEELSRDFEFDDSTTIDDFIKELEAKEKDLHISSEMVIEIDEPDYNENVPEFVKSELPV